MSYYRLVSKHVQNMPKRKFESDLDMQKSELFEEFDDRVSAD